MPNSKDDFQLASELPGRLTAEVKVAGENVDVTLSGTAEVPERELLQSLLERVHDSAERLHAREVRVDVRQLKFMNSSCFKDFVSWLGSVRGLPTGKQYVIRFMSNPAIRWQRASLLALSSFAVDLVVIE